MGQALYRKYRSRSFDAVVGQDHIIKTLKNALKTGRISHAYLFTGPRGVGKTSVARILAHEVNKLDYKDEAADFDIIEIDAASNRRIDEIRDLRERVRIAPVAAEYKVYIIDEVHMLTREAFNALLKTLEEPPAHAIFILATTEAHKLPDTIVSRTQRFEFKPIGPLQAAKHLGYLAKAEKIDISPAAIEILAEFGSGSFRDSISYLDQLSSLGSKISEADVRSILGLPPAKLAEELLDLVWQGDSQALLKALGQTEEQGINPASLAAALSNRLRNEAAHGEIDRRHIELLRQLAQVSASSRPRQALEIVLLTAVAENIDLGEADKKPQATKQPAPQPKPKPETKIFRGDFNLSEWQQVLDQAKAQAASIYTALRLAKPDYSAGRLTLNSQFPLHQKKLAQTNNKDLVAKIIKQVSGTDVEIESALMERPELNDAEEPINNQSAGLINSVFGSAEVLEA